MEDQRNPSASELTITALDDGRIQLVAGDRCEYVLGVGQSADGWMLRWLGGTVANPRAILEATSTQGGTLLFWSQREGGRTVVKPQPGGYDNPPGSVLYGGRSLENVLVSPTDLLGDEVLEQGEATYERVARLLPPARGGRYQILGGPLSRGKVIIWPDGTATTQSDAPSELIYDPARIDSRVGRCAAFDGLLDDWMPVACYRFDGLEAAYDLLAFVLPEEYAVKPAPFMRLVRYAKPQYAPTEEDCRRPTFWSGEGLSQAEFYAALDATVRFWWDFEGSLAEVELPEARAWRWTRGCLAHAAVTFCGDHPKYGAFHYAGEMHDTFPPTVLTIAETAMAWGAIDLARRYLSYYLERVVRTDGSFNYYGPSGTEYAQWLWLLNEVEECDGCQQWVEQALPKVIATGRLLEELRRPWGDSGARLVEIAAEADNRHEAYTYFSNNLWTIVGQRSLASLAARHGRADVAQQALRCAESLDMDIQAAVSSLTEVTGLGALIPSWAGYPANMWTLSIGPPLPDDVPEWEQRAYLEARRFVPRGYLRQDTSPRQWIRENTYANYRYHPESLSAEQLSEGRARALVRLRKDRGGELLGMTRFMAWLDDWPVAAYARHLLTTDCIDDYLLLYYAHMAHHGNRETLTYYEQVTADGQVRAHDCVPCLLVTPMMTRWMLCFEPIGEDALYLLRGVPRAWLEEGKRISARGLVARGGRVDVEVAVGADQVELGLNLPPTSADHQVYVDCRLPGGLSVGGVKTGAEWVDGVERGYRLMLRPGVSGRLTIVLDIARG